LPNQTQDKITHAQNLKDQCKFKEALETLSNIENVNELTVDDQIRFYLLQSYLFYTFMQISKALDTADLAFQKGLEIGNDLVMLDASLAKGNVLAWHGKEKDCYNSILKCEELISRIKDHPEKIIGKRNADLAHIKAKYYLSSEIDKGLEQAKMDLALNEKYGTNLDIALAFYTIGQYYMSTSDFAKGLKNFDNSLKICNEINYKILIAYISLEKSDYYSRIGEFNKSLELCKIFLVLSKKYGTKYDLSIAFNYIGEIHRLQGDLDLALEYYEQSQSINEELGNKRLILIMLENIGLVLYEKGELTKALNYLKRSYRICKEMGDNEVISPVLFDTIPIYLDQNDLDSARTYLEELKNLSEKKKTVIKINQMYRIAKALILKKTGGTRNIIKAEEILKELLEEKSVDNELLVIILLNLIELLYKELKITNETEILEEIQPLITRLLEISEKQHSFSLLTEINIFKAKLELINLELDEGQRLLTKGQKIAQKYNLSRLEKKISLEHDQLLEKFDIWKELKNRNAPISERLNLVSFEGDLNLMMRKKEIEQVKILPEEPLLLSIISKGGLSLFTHFFSKEWEDKMMFSSFITAFNTFSHEFFSKTLDRVKIGENTIIMTPFKDIFLCYVIRGQTYPAQQKLNKFSEGIKNSEEILNAINSFLSTGAIINEENNPDLGKLVSTIFA
jgi:tetratricopeptide (TPR) repeat protein